MDFLSFTMPPVRTSKHKERNLLADKIDTRGTEMSPCSSCKKHNRTCVVLNEQSKRCGECVRRGYRCDVIGPSDGDWKVLDREEQRLAFETRITREAVATAMAKLNRLELQRDLLKKRGSEMLRRGLQTLDELDAVEQKEKEELEREERERDEQQKLDDSSRASLGLDPTNHDFFASPAEGDPLAGVDFSDPFWATLGFAGGTPRASQSNS